MIEIYSNSNTDIKLNLSGISLNRKYITACFSIIYKDTFFFWIPSFDESFKGTSLGKLHIYYLIENCFNEGLVFDFMGGDESYKKQWFNDNYNNFDIFLFNSRLYYYLYLIKFLFLTNLKNIYRRSKVLQYIHFIFTKKYNLF